MITMELKDICCPRCLNRYLAVVQELRHVPSSLSVTGEFIVPASDPIVVCFACEQQFKSIQVDTSTNKIISYELIRVPQREENMGDI